MSDRDATRVEIVPLLPCPFDGGPAILMLNLKGGAVDHREVGSTEAWVWCHECGATGPRADRYAFDAEAVIAVMREASETWNQPVRKVELADSKAAQRSPPSMFHGQKLWER